jgi:hypothetical protein
MADLKIISKKKAIAACVVVNTNMVFDEDSVMSVSEAADLAVELV